MQRVRLTEPQGITGVPTPQLPFYQMRASLWSKRGPAFPRLLFSLWLWATPLKNRGMEDWLEQKESEVIPAERSPFLSHACLSLGFSLSPIMENRRNCASLTVLTKIQ